jgi:SAM-dependent methyltransferase
MAMDRSSKDAAPPAANPVGDFTGTGMGDAWQRGAATRAQERAAATELMLDLASLKPGDRVLDIGAGTGEQSIIAARRIGPTGRLLVTDIAAGMLKVASEELARAGLTNVETRVIDARSMDLASDSFDAVISRMVIMLIPGRERALAEIRRVLRPGGKLAVMVWSTAERNLGTLLPTLIAYRHAGLPMPAHDEPGMYALGGPGRLAAGLTDAGFGDVVVRAVSAPRRFRTVRGLTDFLIDSTPVLREPLSKLDQDGRLAALAEIEETMGQSLGPEGVAIPGEVLVGVGTK